MRVIKYFEHDKKSKLVMRIFDEAISSIYYNWPLDKLEVFLAEKDGVWLEEKNARIFISSHNNFIQSMDEQGIKAVIFHKLYQLILKIKGVDYSRVCVNSSEEKEILSFMEEFIVDRELAKSFPDIIFYKKCADISAIDPNNFLGWVKANLCWLTFYKIDDWNAEFLKNVLENKTRGLDYLFLDKLCKLLDELKSDIYSKESAEKMLAEILKYRGKR